MRHPTRHPMHDINIALQRRNRAAIKIKELEDELRAAHQLLAQHEKICWKELPEGYYIVLGDHWSLSKTGDEPR
jgi:hypothetical protein